MEQSLHISPRYYRWHVDPGVEWVETHTGYAHLNWEIPLSQAALVLVDVWDGHYLTDTAARSEAIIQQKIRPLLGACREAGLQVIHAPGPDLAKKHPAWVRLIAEEELTCEPETDWPPRAFGDKSGVYEQYARPREPRDQEREAFRAGLTIHPAVQPDESEAVIATGEELHRYCTRQGILFLFYVGFNTNACMLLRDYGTLAMGKRGYEITIVRDCTTGMESFETHDALWQTRGAILFLEMFGNYSVPSEDLIAGFQG
ncbi:MAG: isochorismatase family protein [Candidatus Latescibacteria bacterium]|nr:isochorismatase family protein [Candidatus Latescibacterota bacterium]